VEGRIRKPKRMSQAMGALLSAEGERAGGTAPSDRAQPPSERRRERIEHLARLSQASRASGRDAARAAPSREAAAAGDAWMIHARVRTPPARMSEDRKLRIEHLARREWPGRLGLWLAGALLTLLAWAAAVATLGLVRPRRGRAPAAAPGDAFRFQDSPAGRALARTKARLELLGQRKSQLLRLKGQVREHARGGGGIGVTLGLPGARGREARRLAGRMRALAAEVMAAHTRGRGPAALGDAAAWEELGGRATEGNVQAAIDVVDAGVDRELGRKAERYAAYAAEQAPLWRAEADKVVVERLGAEAAAEALAAALEGAGRGGGGVEGRRLREELRAAMEAVRGLDRREDRITRELNRLAAAGAEMARGDRRARMRALLLGVWSASMWAMWARPLVAETWLAVDKSLLQRMRDGREARKKRRNGEVDAKAADRGVNVHADTATTAWEGFRGLFGGLWGG